MNVTSTRELNCSLKAYLFKHLSKKKLVLFSIILFHCSVILAQQKTFTFNLQNVPVEQVIEKVEAQSSYRFLYNENLINVNKKINISVKNVSITELLNNIFKGEDVDFKISNNQIVLTKKQIDSSKKGKQIIGKVVDQRASPLPGVSVRLIGSSKGTLTSSDGSFILNPTIDGDTVLFSYLGFNNLKIAANDINNSTITLTDNFQTLNDVVVIGYGSVKKRDLTGAVTSISSKTIMNQAKMNDPIQALQGQVAGADITSGNAPGATSSIIIRGFKSISASNAPLIIVDEAPFGGRFDEINPAEIQSIDILKDASSTAIYGSRGANGVVIITTKRGSKDGALQIEYDGYYGLGKSMGNFNMMNGQEYADYRAAAFIGVSNPTILDDVQRRVLDNGTAVDWQDLMFSGVSQKSNHNISIGKNRSKFVFGYNKDQGILENSSYDRYTARYTNDNELTKNLTIGYSGLVTGTNRNFTGNEAWRYGTRADPLSEVYDADGQMNFYTNSFMRTFNINNPIFDTKKENVDVVGKRDRLLANFYADWKLNKYLKVRTTATLDKTAMENGNYFGPFSGNRQLVGNGAVYNNQSESSITVTNLLNYSRTFKDIHKLDISFVNDLQKFKFQSVGVSGFDIPYYGKWYNVNEATRQVVPTSGTNEWSILSYMGRINYTINDKYLFTATGRFDGSSRLAVGNKWDFFPSGAFAWRIMQEDFMKDITFVTNLKLRVGYGVTGNTAIDPYSTQGLFGRIPYAFGTSEASAIGYLPSQVSNPDLGWEKTAELNIGLDFGFLNDRISGSVDVYQKNTYDLLLSRNLPTTSGYTSVLQNIGQTRNSGIELALQTIPVTTEKLKISTNFTLSYNKNEIVELFNGKQDSPGNNWFIGQPISVDRIYKFIGVWQTDEAAEAALFSQIPGQGKYQDVNGNKRYDAEDLFTYNRIPKWIGGFSTNVQYKGFDLSVYTYARLDYGSRLGVLTFDFGSTRFNHLKGNYWTPTNPSNEQPKPNQVADGFLMASSFAFRDQSFARIRNINLGYTFPPALLKYIKSKGIRAYVGLDNPYLWTQNEYVGLDPENANSEVDARPLKTLMMGFNVKF
jgi:TonB-linked SusC/RagA family outer membrane protein